PLRIKVFMWFVHKQVILTKDNLAKRNWVGSARYVVIVTITKLSNTSFLIVRSLRFYGGRFILLLILIRLLPSTCYLERGLMGLTPIQRGTFVLAFVLYYG
uniref:Reverse transcriptase zinc-binding domain-containing protein n=1 Tax=Aegilops tauschii subsp. strangulata TaxID=200361 RepID=A0A452XPE3_AEGTS